MSKKSIYFHTEVTTPDGVLIVDFNDKSLKFVEKMYAALKIARGLVDTVDEMHPYTVMYQGLFGRDEEDLTPKEREEQLKEAMQMAQVANGQFLTEAYNYSYYAAFTSENFTFDGSLVGMIKPNIPIELAPDWWDNKKENADRITFGLLPLPDIKQRNNAEIRVAYIKAYQAKYPDFKEALLEGLNLSFNEYAVELLRKARTEEAAKTVDPDGFRSSDVDRHLDGQAGSDVAEGTASAASPQEVRSGLTVVGKRPKVKR